jgi:NhaP-type Na+/H+ or K+/H+ antiporter
VNELSLITYVICVIEYYTHRLRHFFWQVKVIPNFYDSLLLLVQPTFFYLVCEAIGTAATPGLLCQPRVIMKMIMEKQMECRLAGETEVLGENLPQRHFCPSQNPT